MVEHLVVLLGAGASYDCALRGSDHFRPPLTRGLFDPRFDDILGRYPLAQRAASDIRVRVGSGAEAIEEFLRNRLRDSTDPYAQARYRQVPLYLHELLLEVSQRYTHHPENYDRLANAALALTNVVFITLNYDTILDDRLFGQSGGPPTSGASYIDDRRNWSLVKLHGSVNWVKAVNAPPPRQVDHGLLSAFADLGADLSDVLDNEVLLTSRAHVNEMRYNDNRLYYPAVSAPLGSDDELVCPEPHVRFLQGKLKSLRELSLLVVGYSGLDREVLDLLRASNSSLRSLAVVAESKESADLTAARVMDQFDSVSAPPELYAEGFSTWAQAGALDEYFERLMKGTRDS